MWVLLATIGIVAVWLLLENWMNLRRISSIPHRIHVNGSRGKSSVTRLIAAALREGGIGTVAKTTGSSPRYIFPDGSEVLIRRFGQPSINEQVMVSRWARRQKPQALVVECMALQPLNQWTSEHRMIRSTIGVCTNVRSDHLDVMGPTVADVEKALAGTVPSKGVFVTSETTHTETLQRACRDLGTRYEQVAREHVSGVTREELTAFGYIEHPENVALAIHVANLLGVDRATALKGMQSATPDVGALRVWNLVFFGRMITWVNAFAANDPDSTRMIWDRVCGMFPDVSTRMAVVNCREDRPDRSRQLGMAAHELDGADRFVLTGTGTEVFARAAVQTGLKQDRLYTMVGETAQKIFERIVSWSGDRAVVVGMGNIKGMGKSLDEYFRNRAIRPDRG